MPSDTPPPSETSYVNMTQVADRSQLDASLVGSHCEADYCNLLDFLPFLCQSCNKTFCLDHRTESAHKCAHAGAWAERKRQAQLAKPSYGAGRQMHSLVTEKDCASPSCKTRIGTSLVQGVHCDKCNRDYCLKHRFEDDHDCNNLEPIGARPMTATVNKAFNTAFSNFKAWTKTNKEKAAAAAGRALPKAKPTSASQRIIAVNDLKKTAKGDDKLAAEKRVYVYVEAEAATTTAKLPKGKFFYSRDWVVGRVLDAAAKSLQIENINNQSNKEQDKLRVFHVEGGRVLEFSEKVGTALTSGNTIVLLRGVGPSTPDLIEL